MTTEEIIDQLRHSGSKVPREALAEVARRREEFVPLLIAEIERATRLGEEADLNDCLASFALYLLAQFRESRALQPILEYFALDGTTEKELFGDMITQSGSQMLAAVGHGNPGALQEYAKRAGISEWVRWAVLDALALQSIWGEQPREDVVRFLSELMATNAFGEDWEAWTGVVSTCMDLHPLDFLDGIRGLYERSLVDPSIVGDFEDVEAEARRDPEAHRDEQAERRPPITDTAKEVSWWQLFREREATVRERGTDLPRSVGANPDMATSDSFSDGPRTPIRTEPKIGRNDLCPCGSGKKYKKCCLGASSP